MTQKIDHDVYAIVGIANLAQEGPHSCEISLQQSSLLAALECCIAIASFPHDSSPCGYLDCLPPSPPLPPLPPSLPSPPSPTYLPPLPSLPYLPPSPTSLPPPGYRLLYIKLRGMATSTSVNCWWKMERLSSDKTIMYSCTPCYIPLLHTDYSDSTLNTLLIVNTNSNN